MKLPANWSLLLGVVLVFSAGVGIGMGARTTSHMVVHTCFEVGTNRIVKCHNCVSDIPTNTTIDICNRNLRECENTCSQKLQTCGDQCDNRLKLANAETVRYRDLYVREKEQNKRPNEWLATVRTLAFCVLATAGIWRFGWAVNYVAAMSLRPKERNDARAQHRNDAPLVQEPPAMLPAGAAAVVEDVSNLDVAGELIACARNARAGATRKKEVRELLQSHGKMDSATLNAVYERVRTKALLEACTAADIAELL